MGASAAAFAASPAPAKESLTATRAPRAAASPAIVIPRQNCGTHWTGWVNEPGADVNPCPKGCERGKRLLLNEHKNGDTTQYQANYECYLPRREVRQRALKPRAAGAPPRQNCGTHWTGWQSSPDSEANPCPANCERGELRLVNRNRSGDKLVYDLNYRCYVEERKSAAAASPKTRVIRTATIQINGPATKVIRTASIQISGPATKVIRTSMIQLSGPATRVIRTSTIQLNGPVPHVIRTGTIQLSGPAPKVIVTPRIELTGLQQ